MQNLFRIVLLAALPVLAAGEPRKIVVFGMNAEAIREFQAVSPEVTAVAAQEGDAVLAQVADADAIFGTISPRLFAAAKKLKWVQTYSAGVETFRFPALLESNVTLTNCKIIQGPNIADHAMALLLSLTRNLNQIIPRRTTQEWGRGEYHPIELRDKTALVIGAGGIGQQIAQRAHAFGMKVIGVDPKEIPLSPYFTKIVFPDRLDSVIPEADVIFVSAPHTPQSEGMVGARQFEMMKKGAYFIAVSRGKLYDTNALVKAIDSRHLAGAGLDVTNPEPLPKGHALWNFDNVIITPHIAGQSDNVNTRRMQLIKDNIARFVKGEPLANVVDKVKGY